MTTIPKMTIRGFNLNSALVEWEDETHEYYVWVHRMRVQDYVVKKSKEKKAVGVRGRMRGISVTLNLNAKKNADLKAAVNALATPEAVQAAIDAEQTRQEAKETADKRNARIHALRDAVQSIIGAEVDDLAEALLTAPPEIAAAATRLRDAGQ